MSNSSHSLPTVKSKNSPRPSHQSQNSSRKSQTSFCSPRSQRSTNSWPFRKTSKIHQKPPQEIAKPKGPVKRGAVTVLGAHVYRFVKFDPHVEIRLNDSVIGKTPSCHCYDEYPMWEHTMKMAEFEVGAELVVHVVGKRSWPHKDIEFARGVMVLDNDIVCRRYVEEDVDVFFPSQANDPERFGSNHMAFVRIHIDFEMPIVAPDIAPFRGYRRLRTCAEDGDSDNEDFQPQFRFRDTGAGVALPRPIYKNQQIIDCQYWGTLPPRAPRVLCIPMISKFFRLDTCIPRWLWNDTEDNS